MKVLEDVESVCPECFRKDKKIESIDAVVVEEGGSVWLKKECSKHGEFKSIFFEDPEDYKRWKRFERQGKGSDKVNNERFPLYDRHSSQSVLTNLTVTNRCNLRCSYCFMNAGASGYVYEPSIEAIEAMLNQAREVEPVPSKALQITGGEPTVREDLFEIIDKAHEAGFSHIQLNTNGIKLAESKEYCQELKNHGINTVYMSFDGVTKKSNPWLEQNKQAIENLRDVDFCSVVLVPVATSDNIDEIPEIVKFAKENIDIVRGVNIQPIAFTGRIENIDDEYRREKRIDYSTLMKSVEEGLDGQVKKEDWYPVPFVYPISSLVESVKGEEQVEFTSHSSCGGATYLFIKDDKFLPITQFVDVEGMMEFLEKLSEKKGRFKKTKMAASIMRNISDFVDEEKAPEGFSIKKILVEAITGGDYQSLRKFHYESLYLGTMWFQDVWNLNIDRLSKCVIHYTTEEGMIPFCSYNGLGVGEKIREENSIPVEEWEKKTGKKLEDSLWRKSKLS